MRDLYAIGRVSESPALRDFTLWVKRLTPDLEAFNRTLEAVHGLPIPAQEVACSVVLACAWIGGFLLIAVLAFERRTICTILSKPVTRASFLIGKHLGLVATLWLQLAIMVVAFVAVSLAAGAPLGESHAIALSLVALELAVVVAFATLFSSFATPFLAAFLHRFASTPAGGGLCGPCGKTKPRQACWEWTLAAAGLRPCS